MSPPTAAAFATAVYQWQSRYNDLTNDGKLGKNSWSKMQPLLPASGGMSLPEWLQRPTSPLIEAAANEPLRQSGDGPLWLQIARAEMEAWDQAIGGMAASEQAIAEYYMSRDEEYFLASPYFGGRVKPRGTVPRNESRLDWCAAFANWCLHRAGFSHTGSAGADSFRRRSSWRYRALKEPQKGCVIVVGNGSSGAHVAFLNRWENLPTDPKGDVNHKNRQVWLLGGNQSQRITIKLESRKLLAATGTNGVTSPYLWPDHGEANCDHAPASEAGHFCGNIHGD